MRIGFFCPHSDPLAPPGAPDSGGQCVYEARIMEAFSAMEHGVKAFTRAFDQRPSRERVADRAEVARYAMGPEGFLRKEDMGPFLPEFSDRVVRAERDWLAAADLFHGHYWDGGVTALAASLAFGKPLVFTSHSLGKLKQDSLPDMETYRYDIRIPAETRVMRAADTIIALSSVERRILTERYGVDADKIHIVPGGVEVDRFAPVMDKAGHKQELGITNELMVFTVGRLDARKGFLQWIEAMPVVARELERLGRSVTFMMPAGPQSPSESEAELLATMQKRVRVLGIGKHIRWFHRLSDEEIHHAYCAADLFVCPSLYEPFGLVLVEAMAAATPVVATCHGGPVDIVREGVDGYLADPNDHEAWARRVLAVLTLDEARRREMGQAAMQRARERHAWPAVAQGIERVYAGLTA